MPLDGSKIDRALASAAALKSRVALFSTRADAVFNEADHPRASDGKFGSGGGSSAKSIDYKSLKRVGPQLGSNPGGKFVAPGGKAFYVKASKSNDHAKNEVTASRLYALAGSPVLRSEPVDMGSGKLGTATEWEDVKNIDRSNAEQVREAQRDFATHAWLANWDSVGLDYDNQGRVGGKMTTIDVGGSLLYRAQGTPKGDAFGPKAKEFDSLRDPSNRQAHRIFGSMTPEDLRKSAEKVTAVSDDAIRAVVEESGPGSAEQKKALADLLIARKADISKRAGLGASRADDANWKESDHPREADGKFSSTGGSGAAKKGLGDYKSTLSKNAKGSTLGMIKHMLMTGKYSEKDIIDAAVDGFGLTPDKFSYVKFGWKDLQKTGKAPPPIPEKSEFEEPEAKDPGDKIAGEEELENLKLHEPEPKKKQTAKEALAELTAAPLGGAADIKLLKNSMSLAMGIGNGGSLSNEFHYAMNGIINGWNPEDEAVKENVAVKLKALAKTISYPDGLGVAENILHQFTPIPNEGDNETIGKFNDALYQVKKIYGIDPGASMITGPKPPKPSAPEPPKVDPAKVALKEAVSKPPTTAAEVNELKTKMSSAVGDKSFLAAQIEMDNLAHHWDKIQPENQKAVAMQLQMIGASLSFPNDVNVTQILATLKPLPGGGLAKESANKILAALQSAYGATPAAPKAAAYKPTTVVEKAVFEKAKVLPHTRSDNATWCEDYTGAMVKSRLRTDTSKIPGEFFARATSAYGSEPSNGMQEAVDNVMSEYASYNRSVVITPEENKVVGAYKDGDYGDMNHPLIANKGKMTTPAQKRLQAAIMKSVVPADTPSFRGMSASLKDLSGFDDAEHSIGRAFEHFNFASCSRNINTSSNFGDEVMLKFTIPAGANGLTVDGSWEREVVLPARSMFRIDKVEQNPGYGGSAKHVVHCTYLGVREDE